MYFSAVLRAFVASLSLVAALPPTDGRVANDGTLRLIKTSESDPGVWVTEEQKITQYVAKYYLKKNGYSNFRFGNSENSSYIIMTNRVILNKENIWKTENLTNCFDKYEGEDAFSVTRNGMLLSVIRKIN